MQACLAFETLVDLKLELSEHSLYAMVISTEISLRLGNSSHYLSFISPYCPEIMVHFDTIRKRSAVSTITVIIFREFIKRKRKERKRNYRNLKRKLLPNSLKTAFSFNFLLLK